MGSLSSELTKVYHWGRYRYVISQAQVTSRTHRLLVTFAAVVTLCGAAVVDNTKPVSAPTQPGWPVVAVLVAAAFVFWLGRMIVTRRKPTPREGYDLDENKILDSTFAIGATVTVFAIFGILAALISAYGLSDENGPLALLFGTDMLVAAAAATAGGVLGFIFGIPITLDPASRAAVAGAAAQGSSADKTNAMLAANTNLERVSDWLTTLLIGATIVQIGNILHWLREAMTFLAVKQPDPSVGPLVLIAVYFSGLGFLGIYLITRLYLTSALTQTLGLLANGGEGVSDAAAVGSMLANARLSDDPSTLRSGLIMFENWKLSEADRSNPRLNSELCRLLAKYTNSQKADDMSRRIGQLREAFSRAITDQTIKESLRADLASARLSSGDRTTDDALLKAAA